MLPITGPVLQTKASSPTPRTSLEMRYVYKQSRPFNLKLPYQAYLYSSTDKNRYSAGDYSGSHACPIVDTNTGDPYFPIYESVSNAAMSRALTRFNKEKGVEASALVALAQYKQAVSMVDNRLTQVLSVFLAARRFDVKGVLRGLGMNFREAKRAQQTWMRAGKHSSYVLTNEKEWARRWGRNRKIKSRRRFKAVSDAILEVSFGWAPLIGDIENAADVLSAHQYYANPLRGRATSTYKYTSKQTFGDSFWSYENSCDHVVNFRAIVGATLTVTNPNYGMVERLGLVSLVPALVELVPWSFVANYFINLNEFASQFNPEMGVTVTDPHYTRIWEDNAIIRNKTTYIPTGVQTLVSTNGKAVSIERKIGSLPTIRLGLRHSYMNSWQRALTNSALLAKFVKSY